MSRRWLFQKLLQIECQCLSPFPDNEDVEEGEKGEGKDVHEDQVEPGHVNLA